VQPSLNDGFFALLDTPEGETAVKLFHEAVAGVPTNKGRVALTTIVGGLIRMAYNLGHANGVIEQLTTVPGPSKDEVQR
jgi:hypothetical protein